MWWETKNEPLEPLVLALLLVILDGNEYDAPPDEPPFVRPTPRPTPRAMAIRIAAPRRKRFHRLKCVWRQDPFEALPFSTILLSELRGFLMEATAGLSTGGVRKIPEKQCEREGFVNKMHCYQAKEGVPEYQPCGRDTERKTSKN